MGIDLLDVVFRLEKRFAIRIRRGEFVELFDRRRPGDATAGEVAAFVLGKLPQPRRGFASPGEHVDQSVGCMVCGYDLRGLRRDGRCPECGTDVAPEAQVLACVRQVLEDALGVDAEQVHRDSLLIRDLGAG
jgi:acyl carrier protein